MPTGFRLPVDAEAVAFPDVTPEEGLDQLREAISRTQTERMISPHPVFGQMTHEEWSRLHMRHSGAAS